jgi:D-alanine-D-alanine ligase
MKKVLVLMGGMSSEREISLLSGGGVVDALKQKGYCVVQYDLSKNISDFIHVLGGE